MNMVAAAHTDAKEAREQARRTRRTVIYLALAVSLMLIAGLLVGIFLLVRGNDIQQVQDQIENRVTQTEKAFCAFLLQESLITDTPNDKLLANQANILTLRFGCASKGILEPPKTNTR